MSGVPHMPSLSLQWEIAKSQVRQERRAERKRVWIGAYGAAITAGRSGKTAAKEADECLAAYTAKSFEEPDAE